MKEVSDQTAENRAEDLKKQLFANFALNEMAINPLLITMIAYTHWNYGELPKYKVELYKEICSLLLSKRPHHQRRVLTLKYSEYETILKSLAWYLVKEGRTQFTPLEGERWINTTLIRCRKDKNMTPDKFWQEMKETVGILINKELDKLEFTHKTFQEYFAALYLRDLGEKGEQIILDNLTEETLKDEKKWKNWEEVFAFYAALGDASPLINKVLNMSKLDLNLAERYKQEGREVDGETLERLNQVKNEKKENLSLELKLQQRFNNLTPIDENTGITEAITWEEYQLFLEDQISGKFHSTATVIEINDPQKHEPITGISWVDGLWFCAWLGTQTSLQTEGKVYDYDYLNPHSPPLVYRTEKPVTELRIVRFEISQYYANLQNYLANARWKEADSETLKVMLDVAGRAKEGYLDVESIDEFPCENLRIIDQLWLKYSGGHFGFSVQKEIWLQCGGKVDYETECKLGEAVGWRKNGNWVKVIYETQKDTPRGQLPWRIDQPWDWNEKLFLRAANCNL